MRPLFIPTIFDCRFSPERGSDIFVVASDKGLFSGAAGVEQGRGPLNRHQVGESAALSVDWLSHNVFAGGCRDGQIHLSDRRVCQPVSRIKAPKAVVKLRAIDQFRLLAAGLGDNVRHILRYSLFPHPPRSLSLIRKLL